jgi:hypothetical protein
MKRKKSGSCERCIGAGCPASLTHPGRERQRERPGFMLVVAVTLQRADGQ